MTYQELPGVNVRITEVTVCAVSTDSINHHAYAVQVAWRGEDAYAVIHHRECLGADGKWDFEPTSSSRTDEWIAAHRFSYVEAYRLAVEVAPTIVVNGVSATDADADTPARTRSGRAAVDASPISAGSTLWRPAASAEGSPAGRHA